MYINNHIYIHSANEFSGKHRTVHTSCLIKAPPLVAKVCVCVCRGFAASVGDAIATATFLNTKYFQGR